MPLERVWKAAWSGDRAYRTADRGAFPVDRVPSRGALAAFPNTLLVHADGLPVVGPRAAEEVQLHLALDFVAGDFAIVAADELFPVALPLDLEGDFAVFEFPVLDFRVGPGTPCPDLAGDLCAFLLEFEGRFGPELAEARGPFPRSFRVGQAPGFPIVALVLAVPIRDHLARDGIAVPLAGVAGGNLLSVALAHDLEADLVPIDGEIGDGRFGAGPETGGAGQLVAVSLQFEPRRYQAPVGHGERPFPSALERRRVGLLLAKCRGAPGGNKRKGQTANGLCESIFHKLFIAEPLMAALAASATHASAAISCAPKLFPPAR